MDPCTFKLNLGTVDTAWKTLPCTIDSWYIAVQYSMILHTAQHLGMQNFGHTSKCINILKWIKYIHPKLNTTVKQLECNIREEIAIIHNKEI